MHVKHMVLAWSLAMLAGAKVVRIDVGDGGLVFSPNSTHAALNDTIEFHFFPRNHSVAQGDYDSPCRLPTDPEAGFFTGFVAVSEGESVIRTAGSTVQAPQAMETIFRFRVNSTDPIFYYCTASHHCQGGMVGVINPTREQTLQMYADGARLAPWTDSPVEVYGGQLVDSFSSNAPPRAPSTSAPARPSTNSAASSRMRGPGRRTGAWWAFVSLTVAWGAAAF